MQLLHIAEITVTNNAIELIFFYRSIKITKIVDFSKVLISNIDRKDRHNFFFSKTGICVAGKLKSLSSYRIIANGLVEIGLETKI